jgi:hypothetical protein
MVAGSPTIVVNSVSGQNTPKVLFDYIRSHIRLQV